MARGAYTYGKRGLYIWQKRPIDIATTSHGPVRQVDAGREAVSDCPAPIALRASPPDIYGICKYMDVCYMVYGCMLYMYVIYVYICYIYMDVCYIYMACIYI